MVVDILAKATPDSNLNNLEIHCTDGRVQENDPTLPVFSVSSVNLSHFKTLILTSLLVLRVTSSFTLIRNPDFLLFA